MGGSEQLRLALLAADTIPIELCEVLRDPLIALPLSEIIPVQAVFPNLTNDLKAFCSAF